MLQRERAAGQACCLITPEETPVEHRDGPYPFGTPAKLPPIGCVAAFHSSTPARDVRDGSGLTIVWFQHDYGFPVDAQALDSLTKIDWDQHAADWDY